MSSEVKSWKWELRVVSLQLFSFENQAKTSLNRIDEPQVQSSAPCLVLFLILLYIQVSILTDVRC